MSPMTNPYEEQPQAQPSPQTPYPPSGQYPPAGQPQPYGQQSPMPYGQPYGAPPQEHPQGTLILIFGILGIFITIFAPIAWYLGSNAKKEIQAQASITPMNRTSTLVAFWAWSSQSSGWCSSASQFFSSLDPD